MKNKEIKIIKGLKEKIEKCLPGARVILFGSKARGEDTWESDVDLLILVDKKDREEIERIMDICFQFQMDYDVIISPLIHSKEEWNSFPLNISEIKYFIEKEGIRI